MALSNLSHFYVAKHHVLLDVPYVHKKNIVFITTHQTVFYMFS